MISVMAGILVSIIFTTIFKIIYSFSVNIFPQKRQFRLGLTMFLS